MPSYCHELLLEIFRNRPTKLAVELLRVLRMKLPEHDEARTESPDLNSLRPTEHRADLVFFLMQGARKVFGVIVEVQLKREKDKEYAWPAYVANLHARHHCPVCLLVITVKKAVAHWAGQFIDLGPGNRCTPYVIGPSDVPPITTWRDARENPELAVLSAVEHWRHSDSLLAKRVFLAAMHAIDGIDDERSKLYSDLLLMTAPNNSRRLEDLMNSLGFEYQSKFARRYVAEGRTEGRVTIVLKLLTLRFGSLAEAFRTRVRGADDAQLDAVAERVLTAQSLKQALEPLVKRRSSARTAGPAPGRTARAARSRL